MHLNNLEQEQDTGNKKQNNNLLPSTFDLLPNSEHALAYVKIKSLLENYDLNNITPLQALQLLNKIKDDLK
ncbi:TPA: hypothetical protein DCZ39_06170 [Patescibacteria group bacterium]|nr:hypothetical protein [Candidatus Gracilibacteria bacterium]